MEGRRRSATCSSCPPTGRPPPRDLTPGASDVPPFSLGGPEDYAFSPDSKEIAFAKKTDKVEAISTNSDIFTLDLTAPGAQPKQITTGPGADGGPQYSPDGRYLSWRSQARAGFEADRWTLNLLDREVRRSAGSWRPTGTARLTRGPSRPTRRPSTSTAEEDGQVRVYRIELAGGAPKLVLKDGSNGDVQVTPDGKTIVFSRASLTAPAEIYRATADGIGRHGRHEDQRRVPGDVRAEAGRERDVRRRGRHAGAGVDRQAEQLQGRREVPAAVPRARRPAGRVERRLDLPLERAGVRLGGLRGVHAEPARLDRVRPEVHRRDQQRLGRQGRSTT